MRADDSELPGALRRAIVMADRRCNVAALGTDLLFWSDRTRTDWCFHYYGEAPPRPEMTESEA
jgi:CRISPR system Cascade subunit CasB